MTAKRVRRDTQENKRASRPAAKISKKGIHDVVAHIRATRKGVTLGGISIKELIEEGRRY